RRRRDCRPRGALRLSEAIRLARGPAAAASRILGARTIVHALSRSSPHRRPRSGQPCSPAFADRLRQLYLLLPLLRRRSDSAIRAIYRERWLGIEQPPLARTTIATAASRIVKGMFKCLVVAAGFDMLFVELSQDRLDT